jgi:uncharacterized membrane protein YkvA (DUF1232 family)
MNTKQSLPQSSPGGLPTPLVVIAAMLYVISPIDLLPDIFIVLGWCDDIAVIVAAATYVSTRNPDRRQGTSLPSGQEPRVVESAPATERPQ